MHRKDRGLSLLYSIIITCVFIAILATVSYITLHHTGKTNFDEMNTIRIANRSISDIFVILNREQNYPLFYLIAHLLLRFGQGSVLFINIFQLVNYFVSVIFFFFSAREILKSKNRALVTTIVYASLPIVVHQGTNIRMYGIMMAIATIIIWAMLRFFATKKRVFFIIAIICQLILTSLHPIGLFMVATIILPYLAEKISWKKVAIAGGIVAITSIIWIAFFIVKSDIINSFFTTGTHYIQTIKRTVQNMGWFYFYSAVFLIFNISYVFLPFIFMLCVSFIDLIKRAAQKDTSLNVLLLTSLVQFLILPAILAGRINQHHLAVFVPGMTLALFASLWNLREFSKGELRFSSFISVSIFIASIFQLARVSFYFGNIMELLPMLAITILIAALLLIRTTLFTKVFPQLIVITLVFSSLIFVLQIARLRKEDTKECEYIHKKSEGDTIVITQHSRQNFVAECIGGYQKIIMYDEHFPMVPLAPLTEMEVTLVQAERGGSFPSDEEFIEMFHDVSLPAGITPQRLIITFKSKIYCDERKEKLSIVGYHQGECHESFSTLIFEKN